MTFDDEYMYKFILYNQMAIIAAIGSVMEQDTENAKEILKSVFDRISIASEALKK